MHSQVFPFRRTSAIEFITIIYFVVLFTDMGMEIFSLVKAYCWQSSTSEIEDIKK